MQRAMTISLLIGFATGVLVAVGSQNILFGCATFLFCEMIGSMTSSIIHAIEKK